MEPDPLTPPTQGLTVIPTDDGATLSGEVDMANWTTLASALRRVVETRDQDPHLVLDLADVAFIDGHGLLLLVEAARDLGPSRQLVLRGASPILMRLAEALHLDREPALVIEGRGTGKT